MGNANSGNVRDRHKSGDSLPPSSPCGIVKDGQAFSFDKRLPVGQSNPSSPAAHSNNSVNSSQPTHHKIIQLQHSQSNEDEEPYFTRPQAISKSLSKDVSSEDYPETGRPRAVTVSEGTHLGGSERDRDINGSANLPTVFKWDGGGRTAFICGTFSDWKTMPMVKSNFTAKDGDDFVAIVDLPEGEHQYKFLIDDEWKYNASEPTVQTENGAINNIITVRKTDFEVFDALAMDQCNSKSKSTQLISGSPPGSEWAQDIPSYKPWEKTGGPPILPPHLLQVILNKDTPLSCEPTLLPEPNHVMLNHLYALSIKDGVMVLSATHRYRKKYVTTLLYKPI